MENFYFENELKKKCEVRGRKTLKNKLQIIETVRGKNPSEYYSDAILEFDTVIDEYLTEKYKVILESIDIKKFQKEMEVSFHFEPLKSLYSELDFQEEEEYFKWAVLFGKQLRYRDLIELPLNEEKIKSRLMEACISRMLGENGNNFPSLQVTESIINECGIFSDHTNENDEKSETILKKYKFSQEEEEYIEYVGLTSNRHQINKNVNVTMFQIIMNNKLREFFDEPTLQEIIKFMDESEMLKSSRYSKTNAIYKIILGAGIVPANISELVEAERKKIIQDSANWYFNDLINCGGYAFEIDTCIYPRGNIDFNQNVSGLLDKFPFVRLLGDTKLAEDEYMVIYRAPKEKAKGHHFIRVDSDGVVREKDGSGEPRIFEDWGTRLSNLDSNEEAIFAVKKEHQMFGYEALKVNADNENELNFTQAVDKAIKEKMNTFVYHSQEFVLKRDESNVFVGIIGGDVVANVVIENDECKTQIYPEKEKQVGNLTGKIVPIIENGRLQNLDEFLANPKLELDDDAR